MAQPPVYSRQYDFSGYQALNPLVPLPANQVDAEYNAVKTTLDAVRVNLALIQRDDGKLANASVGMEQLNSSVVLGFATPTRAWATATAYALRDTVTSSNRVYICLLAHTSGAVFATDLAAGRWQEILDLSAISLPTINASGVVNAPAGGIASTTVQGAINELDTEKANLASPTFTGNPAAPTPTFGDNDTSLATTAFVQAAIATANHVGTTQIADNAVTTAKIPDNAVTTAKVPDNAITLAKMADASVGTAELVDAGVTLAKMASIAESTVIGRAVGAGTGAPVALSQAQQLAVLGLTGVTSGIVLGMAQGRRQTVIFGPVDTSGRPSFLPSTSGSLSITSQNVTSSAPLVIHAANGAAGRVATQTSNITWSSLTNTATNYLFVDVAADGTLTTGATTLVPTYREGGADVVTSGQATFNIAEMVMKVGNGSTAAQTWRVFVGEAVASGGTITSTIAYAYQGRGLSVSATLPAAAALYTGAHNLGVAPLSSNLRLTCLTTEAGYAVGEVVAGGIGSEGGSGVYGVLAWQANRLNVLSRIGSTGLRVTHATTGVNTVLTPANWSIQAFVDRGW